MPVSQSPQTPQPWAVVVAIAVGVGTIWGALKVVGGIIRAAADEYVLSVLRRKEPELKQVVSQALAAELAAAKLAGERAAAAQRLAESNTEAISRLVESQGQLTATVNDMPRMAEALETCTSALSGIAVTLERMNHELGYVRGRIDGNAPSGVAIPSGAQVPVGR